MPRNPAKSASDGRKARKAGPRPGRGQEDVERARLALVATGRNVAEAARRTGIPRPTISSWIRQGKFDPDEWESIRQERARSAIEKAYEALDVQTEALKVVPRKVIVTKLGVAHDVGIDTVAAAAAHRALVDHIKTFGGKDLSVQRVAGISVVVRGYDPARDPQRAEPPAGGVRVPAQAPAVRPN